MTTRHEGLFAAAYTPFRGDGELDPDAVPGIVEHLATSGVSGVLVCGTTGEFPSLTTDERRAVAEAFIGAAKERLSVIVHVGHTSLGDARSLASHAAEIRADAICVAPPSYFRPADVDALVDCLQYVSEAAPDLPLYYYHIPGLTGVRLPVPDLLREADQRVPSLAGVKYTDANMAEFLDALVRFKDRYLMMFGRDEMLLSALACGATAAIGSTYNLAAPLYRRLWDAHRAGDLETARTCQHRAVELVNVLTSHGTIIRAGKAAMQLIGVDCGGPRLPIRAMSKAERDALNTELEEIGFFEWRTGG